MTKNKTEKRSIDYTVYICLFLIAIALFFIYTQLDRIDRELSSVPHKVCQEQFVKCWYPIDEASINGCMNGFDFSEKEGKIYTELKKDISCNGDTCVISISREVCHYE